MKILKWKCGLMTILLGIVLTVRTIPVYAAEAEEDIPSDIEIIEEEKKDERVPVIFQVGCLDGFKEDISVQIYDVSSISGSKKVLEVILQSNNGYTAENKTLEPNKTYAITVDCKNKNEWIIANADGSAIANYEVGEGPLKLSWQVEKKSKKSELTEENSNSVVADPKSSVEDMGEMSKDYGKKLIEEFMENYSFLEDEASFQTTIKRYTTDKCKKDFLACANSRGTESNTYTDKKWESCSDFEKAMYMLLFVRPNNILLGANSADHANTKEEFVKYIGLFAGLDTTKEYTEKINAIWSWQYDYYKVTGRVEDYFQKIKLSETSSEIKAGKSDTKKEVSNKTTKTKNSNDSKNKGAKERRKELSSKENYISILKKNALNIFLVLVLGGAVFYLYLKKVKKNKKK